MIAAHAIRRLQSLVEVFKVYDEYETRFAFSDPAKMDEEPASASQSQSDSKPAKSSSAASSDEVEVSSLPCRVFVSFQGERSLLPARVQVRKSLHWSSRFAAPSDSPAPIPKLPRDSVSRAQLSSDALSYYQKWLEMEKEVRELGMSPSRISFEVRAQICQRAQSIVSHVRFPMRVRSVEFWSLGSVVTRWPTYHSDKYIWPVGFR